MNESEKHQEPISLVYIINALDTGGAEVGMCRLLDGLDAEKYNVTVVSLNGSNGAFVKRIPDDVTVIDIKDESTRDIVTAISKTRAADVIVGSLFHAVVLSRLAGIVNRDAVVATWQHNEIFKTKRRKQVIGITNRLSDVVLADSEPVAEMYRSEFDVDENFVQTVPIAGVDLENYNSRSHRDRDTVVVGSVGRLVPQKNYRTLIEVADELSDESILFRVAGDGPLRTELEDLIRAEGLDNIELVGEVENVPSFLDTLDIYIQPSRREGLCMTVIEAMAADLPIIGSAVGGIEYNITDGEHGYLHETNDVEGYSRSIRILADDSTRRTDFGRASRDLVEEYYTQNVLTSEFERAVLSNLQ
ncbi:glycosyltransferase family 4 protein [Halostagnicola sp. A-GB9-2]|uniref:glycosyltransferase family 4 protein n=1 Tax=Halostagnicola sp. A-GB9-2 TaxID=3048066 RepID=UPI0024BF8F5A|nr:glycosyltransferase family 4 protein [Halostagnicola sp. A-GB9-2]MDJ1431979.1 glycosyltransferase family 4 protein [Halostagnicola sp. A-GB9-2]